MTVALTQHQTEIQRNLVAWQGKPLLQTIYAGFYRRIIELIAPELPGQILEIGSGIGNLKSHYPHALSSDLFPNPWLDLVCDGYELPFEDHALSHLILFDVFHHLLAPKAFLREAKRALTPGGRLILFEPYVSCSSYPVYGLFHHEPVSLTSRINLSDSLPRRRDYYAAQGNATRLFFGARNPQWLEGWKIFHRSAFASFSYLLSGGFSKPSFYRQDRLCSLERYDQFLSRWPRLFAARCLIGLQPCG
jgi:SAM-dependent methyltransferase